MTDRDLLRAQIVELAVVRGRVVLSSGRTADWYVDLRRIEGPEVTGRRALVVEDTSTTGTSALTAVTALREAGAEVVGVAAVVDRGGGAAVLAAGLDFRAAYTLPDLGLA